MTELFKDRALLRAFREGEPAALERVYFEHAAALEVRLRAGLARGGVRLIPLSDADVRDVLQDVFIRAFSPKARARYDGLRPFSTYLQTIARNLLIDRARRRGIEVADDVEFLADAGDGIEQSMLDAELKAATREYVDALDPEQRQFVALRFEQERSQEDVARTMGVTRRRVRTLERTVHAGLKTFLAARDLQPRLASETPSRAAEVKPS